MEPTPPITLRVVGTPKRSLGSYLITGIALIHIGTVIAFARGVGLRLVALAAAVYLVRMFAITPGYHRYFAHRSFKTSRTRGHDGRKSPTRLRVISWDTARRP